MLRISAVALATLFIVLASTPAPAQDLPGQKELERIVREDEEARASRDSSR